MRTSEGRYVDGTYLHDNPDWHSGDAAWKADQVARLLLDHSLAPQSICDVGCGSGEVLAHLKRSFPDAKLVGFDVSPQAAQLWKRNNEIERRCGSFHELNTDRYALLLMLDVFEHVRDPLSFLEATLPAAERFVFHIPLDLSALSVLRRSVLPSVRRSVGHLHFYTKDLALDTLADAGFEILHWRYTGACFSSEIKRSLRTMLASLPRRLAFLVSKDLGVRMLGGETLLVLARARQEVKPA